MVGIHRQALAKLLEDDDQLRNAVTAVQEKITDDLEAIAIERAATSSDRLLEFLLKGRRRDVYGDKRDVTMTHRVLQFGRDEANETDEEVLEAQIVEERVRIAPCSIQSARLFVAEHHRHSLVPRSGLFAARVEDEDGLTRGVVIVGRPVARMLEDGYTAEVTRMCTDGSKNACSMLYGAAWRAARALGYRRLVTYTLASEPGTSLLASGWCLDALLPARAGWDAPSRPRYESNLLGETLTPVGAKQRWLKTTESEV